jgi:cell division protein FtsW (lipid II flippase)
MKQNMGSTDSFVRVMIGIAFYTNIFALQPSLGPVAIIVLFALGTLCMVTAWIKYCSALALLGISTCSSNECCAENSCQCSAQ